MAEGRSSPAAHTLFSRNNEHTEARHACQRNCQKESQAIRYASEIASAAWLKG
jgi:hypothetical protein